jgi:signal transduction histidine kinase
MHRFAGLPLDVCCFAQHCPSSSGKIDRIRCLVLHEFIALNRDEIIRRCRAKVATRSVPPPTDAEIDHGVPVFLDQLRDALRLGETTSPEIGRSAIKHGHDLLRQGFTVSQVVHDYGDVCQAITELAVELNAPISTDDFRTLNRCLDDAIAGAVTEYGRERNQSGIDGESARGTERLGFFAHELRNLLNTALMAFEVLKTGNVGVLGSTGTVLYRTLVASHSLVTRSLAEVRLTQGIQNRELVRVAAFIEEVASASTLDANARQVRLIVPAVEDGVAILADRQVLAAVVANLLQNAFKFTRPQTTVTLRVGASAERVLIEVQDECGGLPSGDVNELFRPFEQRSADRTGMGLGLAFSRWGAEANEGRIYARNLPGRGCVFTVDLPRQPLPAAVVIPS